MGLNSSKHSAPGPSSSSLSSSSSSSATAVRRSRSSRTRALKPSCLRSHRFDCDESQISDCPNEENGKSVSCQVSSECYGTDEDEPTDLHDWDESNGVSEQGNTSMSMPQPSNPPSRLVSRFSFYPGNLSFRLARSSSSAAARSYQSGGVAAGNEDGECVGSSRSDRLRGCEFLPSCFSNRSPRMQDENGRSNPSLDDGCLRNRDGSRVECNPNLFSPENHMNSDSIRHAERRFSTREPAERNVRFSRTLSVGRLRDRVLRRASAADLDLYHFPQSREERLARHRRGLGHTEVEATPDDSNDISNIGQQTSLDNVVPSTFSNGFHDSPRVRETRYRDLLEHRSNFLERRRRIRSQVRALQRLGSRFENMSGHERSCILSGQHRGGHCSCCLSAREGNSNDDANARASISRIVMLAEALFEVLDEIHQQSVVLSSSPSVSPIGSVPAPNEVVESLPLKTFNKLKRKPCEDAAQCYICLVEYEDGDSMRVLPCRHEFHRDCVDKWLKEIHRVCPLCRGDICRVDSIPSRS
ncbi:uncharacterized protein LOC127265653 [Andrographis paniculata]|uniref:uncharacterized protein LOC127265653 n=1 Tax=Andrographis paniculata TaxID=175694 RepID=UPI0021E744EB|nr:uncharacterized protein LOC127265653 [Andrographis paniculata]